MAAYTANQVSINNGQKNVVVNSNESPEGVSKGDFIHVGTFTPMEINRTYVDSSGKHVIELLKAWGNSNQSNQPAIVIPTTVQFKDTVKALQTANRLLNDNTQAMQDWQTKTGTVAFVDAAGVSQSIKTLKQMQIENDALHPYPWAMRKVEFEAKRKQNNEMFAASGFVHFGKRLDSSSYETINEGMYSGSVSSGSYLDGLNLGVTEGTSLGSGLSKSNTPSINIAGVITKIDRLSSLQVNIGNIVKFPPAEKGDRTYDSATGLSVTHATSGIAFSSETETNKVVTERVDMWGFEAFLRELTDEDPFVYQYGLIQSLATTINGVSTSNDTKRPAMYFSWYEGDIESRGKGVNWQAASETTRIKIARDPLNNIYFDDVTGKFYQWCIRGRSFAGAGNGDWLNLESPTGGLQFANPVPTYIGSHGALDTAYTYSPPTSSYRYWGPLASNASPSAETGVNSNNAPFSSSANGVCYFLVCGTVSRLNQGAYHPSFNPMGAGTFRSATNLGHRPWYHRDIASNIRSKSTCFSGVLGALGLDTADGRIISAFSGRPDGRFYDAIYASGQGGVCRDMRYSAWGLTKQDFSEGDLKIKAGVYRGREAAKFIKIHKTTLNAKVSTNKNIIISGQAFPEVHKLNIYVNTHKNSYIVDSAGTTFPLGRSIYNGSDTYLNSPEGTSWENPPVISGGYYLIVASERGFSLSGDYTATEVIGSPSEIILCEGLKHGWLGSWNPILPNGYSIPRGMLRKVIAWLPVRRTENKGNDWSIHTISSLAVFDTTNNSASFPSLPASSILVLNYTTPSRMTEGSLNSVVEGGMSGVGSIMFGDTHDTRAGNGLMYSLIGEIGTSTVTKNKAVEVPWLRCAIFPINGFIDINSLMEHAPAPLIAPSNNSSAFKALNYNVVENQQGFINYAYTELKHDGTDWGDDGKINIVDNQSTRTDDNGNTVVYGTARIVEPIGWIKNDK
ncbi:hypothetical protein [Pseudoalteromonas sp. 5-MNA-CIBAN-0065]|uniref:hypothetical protein n=1 Tax=Pseudoalteromonas sp. 5-MNA-CIBAN-0065 TaxID=3140421 RepID=UPI003333AABB